MQTPARLSRLNEIFARIEQWTMTKTKFEAMEILNKDDIPCGPILSMKELAEDQSLRATGTVVEVDHPTRGKYLSVGNPSSCRTAQATSYVRRCSASTPTRSCARSWASVTIRSRKSTTQGRSRRRASRPPNRAPASMGTKKAVRSWAAFLISVALTSYLIALRVANCCYANKLIVSGIWYT